MRLAAAILMIAIGSAGAQEKTADQLRKGVLEEETNHDLDKAIQIYQSVLKQFEEERKTAASAAFRMAECYRKQGKKEQAAAAYNRVAREFGDQRMLSDQSRYQLAKIVSRSEGQTVRVVANKTQGGSHEAAALEAAASRLRELQARYTDNHPDVKRLREEVAELERIVGARRQYRALLEDEIRLVEEQIQSEQRKVDTGVTNFDNLNKLKRDVLALRRALVLSEGAIDPAIEPFPRQVRPK
jgi:hypothetical protein